MFWHLIPAFFLIMIDMPTTFRTNTLPEFCCKFWLLDRKCHILPRLTALITKMPFALLDFWNFISEFFYVSSLLVAVEAIANRALECVIYEKRFKKGLFLLFTYVCFFVLWSNIFVVSKDTFIQARYYAHLLD